MEIVLKKSEKKLDLTQTEFASRIGLLQNTITRYENNQRSPSSSVINNICKTFDINEEWLRTGNGDMLNPTPKSELEFLVEKYELSHEDFLLIEEFVNLKKEQRMVITEFIKKVSPVLQKAKTLLFRILPSQASPKAKIK